MEIHLGEICSGARKICLRAAFLYLLRAALHFAIWRGEHVFSLPWDILVDTKDRSPVLLGHPPLG